MDPNANLQEQEDLLTRTDVSFDEEWLLNLRFNLCQWLRMGGFEPDWEACPNAAAYYGR